MPGFHPSGRLAFRRSADVVGPRVGDGGGPVPRRGRPHIGQRPGQQPQACQHIRDELRIVGGRPGRLDDERQHADNGEEEGADHPAGRTRGHDPQYRPTAFTREETIYFSPDKAHLPARAFPAGSTT